MWMISMVPVIPGSPIIHPAAAHDQFSQQEKSQDPKQDMQAAAAKAYHRARMHAPWIPLGMHAPWITLVVHAPWKTLMGHNPWLAVEDHRRCVIMES